MKREQKLQEEIFKETPIEKGISYGLLRERVLEDSVIFIPGIGKIFNNELQILLNTKQIIKVEYKNSTYYTRNGRRQANNIYGTKAIIQNPKTKEILILRNLETNLHDLPGGHTNSDETIHHSIIRETQEETGIKLINPNHIHTHTETLRSGLGNLIIDIFYSNNYITSQQVPETNLQTLWILPQDIEQYQFRKTIADILEKPIKPLITKYCN